MGRRPGRPKLSDVLGDANGAAKKSEPAPVGEIAADEAAILTKIGMSGADVNDKARWALTYYLQALIRLDAIADEDAKVCLEIMRAASTSDQKSLCNKILATYVSKFAFSLPGAFAAEKVAKVVQEPVAA